MKKFAVTAAALIVLLGLSGCAGVGKGKGKAPPPVHSSSGHDQGVTYTLLRASPNRSRNPSRLLPTWVFNLSDEGFSISWLAA